MTFNVRRVVTGHDNNGRAIVTVDEIAKTATTVRAGTTACLIWSTLSNPPDNMEPVDGSTHAVGTSVREGTVFRLVRFEPGNASRMHRTESLDYAIVVSGEIDMELDDTEVHMRAGDVMVQRGTVHNWTNRGSEPCVVAFVLIGAPPVEIAGKTLGDVG